MKKLALALLFLVGCTEAVDGSQSVPRPLTATWNVDVNEICRGQAHLAITYAQGTATTISGDWSCTDHASVNLGGAVDGLLGRDGTVIMKMGTTDADPPADFAGLMDGFNFYGRAGIVTTGGIHPVIAKPAQ